MSYLDTPKGRADLLRGRAQELLKLADQIEAGHEPSPRDLERHLEYLNAETSRAMNAFYEHDRLGTRLQQAEANLTRAIQLAKSAEARKAKELERTEAAVDEFHRRYDEAPAEKGGLRGTMR
jgi:hypothetical protein